MGDGGENDTKRKLEENPFSGDFNDLGQTGGTTADRLRNDQQFDRQYNTVDQGAQREGNPLFDEAYQRQEVARGNDRRPELPAHIERYLDPNGNNVINVYYINANRVEIGNQRDAGRPYVDPAVYREGNWERSPQVRISQDRYQGPRDLYGDYYRQATRNPQGRVEYYDDGYRPQQQVSVRHDRDTVSGGPGGYYADRERTRVNTGGGYDDYRTPPYAPERVSSQQSFDNFLRVLDVGASIYGISRGGRGGGGGWNQVFNPGYQQPRYGYDPRYGGYDPRYGGYDPRYGGYDPRYGNQGSGPIIVETYGRGGNANVRRDRDVVSGGAGGYHADRERTRVSTGSGGGYDDGYYADSGQRNFDNIMKIVDVGAAIYGIHESGRGRSNANSNYYNQGRDARYGGGANFQQRYAQQAYRAYGYRQG